MDMTNVRNKIELRCRTYKSSSTNSSARLPQRYSNVTWVRPPTEGFPWDDLRKILHAGQRMAKVHSGEKILPKVLTP